MWVVDTCVVLDVFEHDPRFGRPSAELLQRLLRDGLVTPNAGDFRRWFPDLEIREP